MLLIDPVDVLIVDAGLSRWGAIRALEALRNKDWRIVHAAGPDESDLDDDPDSPTYGQHVASLTIAAEWTPEADHG